VAAPRWTRKMTKTLSRRLERLEEQMIPAGEPTILHIVGVDSDGNQTEGPKFEVPAFRPRTPMGPRTWMEPPTQMTTGGS
jgi:hypothetical protein